MKRQLLAVLALVLSGALWAEFGPSNTIILSGWPVTDTSVSDSVDVTLETCGPAIVSVEKTDFDGGEFGFCEADFAGDFSSLSPGLMIFVR